MSNHADAVIHSLLEKNIVLIHGEVNLALVAHTYRCLTMLEIKGSPEIEIRFSIDRGGSTEDGLNIYDALRRYKNKKIGVVCGYARSIGAIILQACEERVCLQHSVLQIHNINTTDRISFDVMTDKVLHGKLMDEMWANQKNLYSILKKRTSKSEKEISDACKAKEDMGAIEALQFGLVDRIEKSWD